MEVDEYQLSHPDPAMGLEPALSHGANLSPREDGGNIEKMVGISLSFWPYMSAQYGWGWGGDVNVDVTFKHTWTLYGG